MKLLYLSWGFYAASIFVASTLKNELGAMFGLALLVLGVMATIADLAVEKLIEAIDFKDKD